jgi:hypothetical protein
LFVFCFVFLDTPPLDRSWNRKKLTVTVSRVYSVRVCDFSKLFFK